MHKLIFQFFHWYYPKGRLWKEVASQASHLEWLGISDVWLPPPYKSSAGSNGVGYDVYDLLTWANLIRKARLKQSMEQKSNL